jgi:hypothetical protein
MGILDRLRRREERQPQVRRGDPYRYRGGTPAGPPVPLEGRAADVEKPRGAGLAYAHYMIPRDNDVRPTPFEVNRLIEAWLAAGYIAAPGSTAQQRLVYAGAPWTETARATGAALLRNRITFTPMPVPLDAATLKALAMGDYRMTWPIETAWLAGLKLPVTSTPVARRGGNGPGYTIEVHSLADYVHLTSDLVGPFPADEPITGIVPCRVSQTNLRYSADRFDNMFDDMGSRVRLICPTCSTRFRPQERTAQVRDGWSGKVMPLPGGATYRFAIQIDFGTEVPEVSPRATPEFKAISEKALGLALYEVGNAY